jgi:hypothetical protein
MVTLSKEGYESATNSVRIKGGETTPLSLTLTGPRGEIDIVTTPPGLEVSIDGRPYGPSPVHTTLPAGEHTYTVKGGGQEVYRKDFKLESGAILTTWPDLSGALIPSRGVVMVRTVPEGASVIADGTLIQGRTPFAFSLSVGRHTLVISLPGSGKRPQERVIDVQAGDNPPVDAIFR